MDFKCAELTEEQISFLKKSEQEFTQKFGNKIYLIAVDGK